MVEQPTFEEALQQLEDVVARLEQGRIPLDEALACFEVGVKNAGLCRKMLRDVEARVETLIKNADGSFTTEEFASGNSGSDE